MKAGFPFTYTFTPSRVVGRRSPTKSAVVQMRVLVDKLVPLMVIHDVGEIGPRMRLPPFITDEITGAVREGTIVRFTETICGGIVPRAALIITELLYVPAERPLGLIETLKEPGVFPCVRESRSQPLLDVAIP